MSSSRVRNIAFSGFSLWLPTRCLVSLSANYLCLFSFLSTTLLEFSAIPTVQKHQVFSILILHGPTFASKRDYWENECFCYFILVSLVTFLCLSIPSNSDKADFRIMILLLISLELMPSLVTIEPKKHINKADGWQMFSFRSQGHNFEEDINSKSI